VGFARLRQRFQCVGVSRSTDKNLNNISYDNNRDESIAINYFGINGKNREKNKLKNDELRFLEFSSYLIITNPRKKWLNKY